MALKTGNGLSNRLAKIENNARILKQNCQNLVNLIDAGNPVDSGRLLGIGNDFNTTIAQIDSTLADPDLSALESYAQSAYNDVSYDLSNELTASRAAIVSAATSIQGLPNDGSYYLVVEMGANGSSTFRNIPAASLAAFNIELQAIIATLD
jgi:hypothetical protein